MKKEYEHHQKIMTPQEAVAEASRCIGCADAPCRQGCPAANDVVKFIRQISQKNFKGAIKTVRNANVLAGTCALICPVGDLCEFKCGDKLERPVAIGSLQRFVAEYEREHGMSLLPAKPSNGRAVGIIGSGPAGLSAGFELRRLGFDVEIHESEDLPGGILTYGIPSHRLDPSMVADEIEYIKAMGVRIINHSEITDLSEFSTRYDAVFIGVGYYRPLALKINGANIDGVHSAIAYLKDARISQIYKRAPMINLGKRIIIIGGGNTAIDAATSARFSGAEVTLFYRRSRADMPAFKPEIEEAEKSGVIYKFNHLPLEFRFGTKGIEATFCRTKPGTPDQSGRPIPEPIVGSEEIHNADNIIVAVGQSPSFSGGDRIKTDNRGLILVDKSTGATSMAGVFAGGDAVNGGATAVQAVADGKQAAHGIDQYVKGSVDKSEKERL